MPLKALDLAKPETPPDGLVGCFRELYPMSVAPNFCICQFKGLLAMVLFPKAEFWLAKS
jgi:hypothetical protein